MENNIEVIKTFDKLEKLIKNEINVVLSEVLNEVNTSLEKVSSLITSKNNAFESLLAKHIANTKLALKGGRDIKSKDPSFLTDIKKEKNNLINKNKNDSLLQEVKNKSKKIVIPKMEITRGNDGKIKVMPNQLQNDTSKVNDVFDKSSILNTKSVLSAEDEKLINDYKPINIDEDDVSASFNLFESKHRCEQCSFTTMYRSNLQSHVKQKHQTPNSYPCQECNYVTSQKGNLQRHVATVHELARIISP